jgi:predicted ribosome quality control (RQC) complex YloA/Tae2 family protein
LYANENNEWEFKSMAFFRKPLGDYEVEMVFYDITNGSSKSQRRFLDSFTQYTQDRNTRSLMGKATLIRPRFDANRKYMVIVQKHGKQVASGKFSTRGISQKQLDQEKRMKNEMKKMEESMKELQKKAKEQEEAQKKRNQEAGQSLF